MELIKVLSNPVRIQVMQYLQAYGESTIKQISEVLTDIPKPTLYRHISILLQEEVLIVKEERKVRGSLERLLAINTEKLGSTSNSDISDNAYQFLMEIYMRFQKYSCKENVDPKKDKLSLKTCVLTLTDDRFDDFMCEIAEIVKKYQIADKEGKLRSVSFISAPVDKECK